jgi:hypothetical protein
MSLKAKQTCNKNTSTKNWGKVDALIGWEWVNTLVCDSVCVCLSVCPRQIVHAVKWSAPLVKRKVAIWYEVTPSVEHVSIASCAFLFICLSVGNPLQKKKKCAWCNRDVLNWRSHFVPYRHFSLDQRSRSLHCVNNLTWTDRQTHTHRITHQRVHPFPANECVYFPPVFRGRILVASLFRFQRHFSSLYDIFLCKCLILGRDKDHANSPHKGDTHTKNICHIKMTKKKISMKVKK